MSGEKLHIRIGKDLLDQVKKMAERENRSLNNYVETVLKKEIQNAKPRG